MSSSHRHSLQRRLTLLITWCSALLPSVPSPLQGQDLSIQEAPGKVFRQASERQQVAEYGASTPSEPTSNNRAGINPQEFSAGPVPEWIWGTDENQAYTLETTFTVSDVETSLLKASCDNVGSVWINGLLVARSVEWQTPMQTDVTKYLVKGKNSLTAKVANEGSAAGFVLKLAIRDTQGKQTYVTTNAEWKVADGTQVAVRGKYGIGPWGNVFQGQGYQGRVPAGTFEVRPGFAVERLFQVPKDQLGSWVCIALDGQGRLLASDQGEQGICRISLPPVTSDLEPVETIVEPLDFSRCEIQPTGAQGMLYAFDSLYFCINGGPGSGLYRARDTDGDDQYDECVRLKAFHGGGEHGPHSLRLSPDGNRIFVIAGNHTQPPFQAGQEQGNPKLLTTMPSNWDEDLLLPRMWDANGHARGVLAPGGWIASTDPDGQSWHLWSIGYRNPYDMAFNADGQLFAYDADMEWDYGAPWYRPTRVVHATRGSEFGWRSGTGKWPTHYLDSLPPLVDIGPGSPVGVDFGYGLRFPAKYQNALYICDWTFGTMYAIHLQPQGSSYAATKEEFLARNALPLTDVVAAPDGALYFTVGGRGTQSELYRVTYRGTESTQPAIAKDSQFRNQRRMRHLASIRTPKKRDDERKRIENALHSDDRFVRYAGLLTASRAPVGRPLELRSPEARITWLAALAKHTKAVPKQEQRIVQQARSTLQSLFYPALSTEQKLDYLRAVSLCFLRRPEIATDEFRDSLRSQLEADFPTAIDALDRELCQVLVYLDSPDVVTKAVERLNQDPQRQDIDMQDLLARNRGYGNAIHAMIENQPDHQQVWYAFCLRTANSGWTPQTREDYFHWFGKAMKWSGGNSFRRFLQNIENEAYERTTENERVLLERAGAREPFRMPELPTPEGPGKHWTLTEVRELTQNGLRGRNFANGQKMFAATRCVLCHRFAGNGGATGPDLTQLAGRFDVNALTEAMIEPSKVVSDQYQATTVVTSSGKQFQGRIVSENDQQISVLTDPEDSTQVVDVRKTEIEQLLPSLVSIMPENLLDSLNRDEVLDLLAYLLSRGDERHEMFQR